MTVLETAGGVELQAFALAYGLGFALLVDAAISAVKQRRQSAPNSLRCA